MSKIPRRKIDEIKTRYRLEPELRDYYVEGSFDKEIFSAIKENVDQDVKLYEIDSIEIPAEILERHNLTSGNKQRVIALAKELADINKNLHFRCIVDKDMDHWLNRLEEVPRLKWTEPTSIELYFFSKKMIGDFIFKLGKGRVEDETAFIDSLIKALKTLYSIRLAQESLGLKLEKVDASKNFSLQGSNVQFDVQGYCRRWLSKSNKLRILDDLINESEEWLKKLECDPRLCIRGHDFIEALAWGIRSSKGLKEMACTVPLERILLNEARHSEELTDFFNQL